MVSIFKLQQSLKASVTKTLAVCIKFLAEVNQCEVSTYSKKHEIRMRTTTATSFSPRNLLDKILLLKKVLK